MPADEVTRGTDVETFRVRTGPRHAAPKKPLFTRFHMPAGKAIALAAMPTAVLMGMGFTPTLAQAEDQPQSKSLTADEYKDCLKALEDAEKDDASASPGPSASASDSASPSPSSGDAAATEPSPSASAGDGRTANPGTGKGTDNDSSSSSDSGSDDKDEPAPAPSATSGEQDSGDRAEPAPSPSETDRNVLEDIGGAIKDAFTPKDQKAEASPAPTPSASATEGAAEDAAGSAEETTEKAVEKATEAAQDTAEETADKAETAAEDAAKDAAEVAETPEAPETPESTGPATASPSPSDPSGSAPTDLDDCPVATDAEGGVDNKVPLPDDPWFLNASSLLLKGADYQGIVEVRTASGKVKKVLKYVVSDGTDIGDLHQTVEDKSIGKTHHVQAAKGSMSTIRDGDTVMYTERISGKLLGLIPVTFDPENPPPLNIPLIYFTDVTVQQAGQFGGTLHVPGLHQYVT